MLNQKNIVLYFIVLSIFALSQIANATEIPNDNNNYLGDKISFPVNITVKDNNKEYCIPAGTTLWGLGAADTNGGIYVYMKKTPKKNCDGLSITDSTPVPKTDSTPLAKTVAPINSKLSIDKATLTNPLPNRFGLTYGALVVPFKYHLAGSKEFKGESAIGPYLGYRFDENSYGFGVKAILFAGGSTVAVSQTVDGNKTTQSLACFSYGLGFIGQIKNDFQLGIIFGSDRVGESAKYEDNGKVWVAVALGFSFSK